MLALLVYLLLATVATDSARILAFFPFPKPSHHFVYRPVLEELGKRGHEVLYFTVYPYKTPPEGILQVDLSEYVIQPEEALNLKKFGEFSIPKIVKTMFLFGYDAAPMYLGNPNVQELIHSDEKFDAVMFESYLAQEYLSALIHKFNAVGIEIISLGDFYWTNELAGLPDNPAYQLDWKTEQTNNMDFWQRLYSTYVTGLSTCLSYYYLHTLMQPVMDRYFNYSGWETRPSIDVLAKNRSLILVNAHPFLGYPFPTAPHVKAIGGINIRPNKTLPEELLNFMDESQHGVIYMSFGSSVNISRSSYIEILDSFISAFKELPQRVLIKYESNYSGQTSANVKMYQWMPQQNILAHRNVVLFITQGGCLSMFEAVYNGVPLLGVPIFADQPKNLIYAESQGFGRMLRNRNVTRETILWNIREILTNKRYENEAVRRSSMLTDTRHTPAEEAVYWIEHSLRYPFALTPKAVSLSAFQLHMLDIKIFIISVFFIIVYIIFRLVNTILKASLFSKKFKKPKEH